LGRRGDVDLDLPFLHRFDLLGFQCTISPKAFRFWVQKRSCGRVDLFPYPELSLPQRYQTVRSCRAIGTRRTALCVRVVLSLRFKQGPKPPPDKRFSGVPQFVAGRGGRTNSRASSSRSVGFSGGYHRLDARQFRSRVPRPSSSFKKNHDGVRS